MVSFKATLLRYLWFLVIRAVIVLERERSALSRKADRDQLVRESPLWRVQRPELNLFCHRRNRPFVTRCLLEPSAPPIATLGGFCELDHWQRPPLTDQPSELHFWKIEEITASALCSCKHAQIFTTKVKSDNLSQ